MDETVRGVPGQLCSGCLRTLDEIIAWGNASDAYKRSVWRAIAERRAQRDPDPS
jgi:predicted Fe-S protein YdhL (DUF1289 family)